MDGVCIKGHRWAEGEKKDGLVQSWLAGCMGQGLMCLRGTKSSPLFLAEICVLDSSKFAICIAIHQYSPDPG